MNIEKTLLNLNKEELLDHLSKALLVHLPSEIENLEEMREAGKLLIKLSSSYSYANGLYSFARIKVREAKRTLSKEEYEDLVDKKEIIGNICDSIKQQYNAISRAVTIKIKNDEELKMLNEL